MTAFVPYFWERVPSPGQMADFKTEQSTGRAHSACIQFVHRICLSSYFLSKFSQWFYCGKRWNSMTENIKNEVWIHATSHCIIFSQVKSISLFEEITRKINYWNYNDCFSQNTKIDRDAFEQFMLRMSLFVFAYASKCRDTAGWPLLHIEAETKWPTFSRRHFQMHFLEWKCISFD